LKGGTSKFDAMAYVDAMAGAAMIRSRIIDTALVCGALNLKLGSVDAIRKLGRYLLRAGGVHFVKNHS
jgi:hypothetical protein